MMEDPEQPPSTDPSLAPGAVIDGVSRAGVRAPCVDVGVTDVRAPADADRAALVRLAQAALGELGHGNAELSVLLCGDRFIRDLNLRFRGIDAPTDVLSFEQESTVAGRGPILGDVVISLDTARRQARRRNVPESAEIRELLLHGILHLLGRDHGDGDAADEPMLQEQRRLLESLPWASGSVS